MERYGRYGTINSSELQQAHIDGLVQDCSNSIANALELLQSCAKPSIYFAPAHHNILHSTSTRNRGVTIRLATIRYISRYTTHDMVHDTIQNQLIYYQWKILKHCGMCHQYCYIKTVILARNSEFKINKDVHNHPCPKYLLLTNCVCKQNNKIS